MTNLKRSQPIKSLRGWNRCDVCGKFFSIDDLISGKVRTTMVFPDSDYTSEEFSTKCGKCNAKGAAND